MTTRQALALLRRHGVMLEAARGPVPNIADAVAGVRRPGSWWAHPRGREIFAITRALRESSQVLVTRLVDGRITFVHRRVWPALVRVAPRLPRSAVARLKEVHSSTGAHRIQAVAFPRWVPDDVRRKGAAMTDDAAERVLGRWIVPLLSKSAARSAR